MRIQELEICNFRGIKHLELSPGGRNFLISGPNGSGKSAIVDAVDFLLTGDVSRMKGPGTSGIKLKDHAPHIKADAKDCWVKAIVKLHGIDEPVEIKRNMDEPRVLVCDEEYVDDLEPVQELASRGQHVLTRREILNYVTANANTRSKQIQNLLKISEVSKTREKLRKVRNLLNTDFKNVESNLKDNQSHINTTVGVDSFNEDVVLNFVNENREILKGEALNELHSSDIKEGIQSPGFQAESSINLELLEKDLQNLPDSDFEDELELLQSEFRELYGKIKSDETSPEDRLLLNQLGLNLAGDVCPLCDTPWDPDELKSHLSSKLENLKEVQEDLERIKELSGEISELVKNKLSSIDEVLKASKLLGLDQETNHLMVWNENLLRITALMDSDDYRGDSLPEAAPLEEVGNRIFTVATERYQTTSPEQTAWDNLNRLVEHLEYYEENLTKREEALYALRNAEALHEAFIESRDQVLNDLYTDIKDLFVELYRQLHGSDEGDFDAILTSGGAGVDFKVTFHGEGTHHPPHALHSEGHQDSMGICLYLALAERLTKGYIDLIILDDVMMSVDAPHRRQICHLLADFFKGKQFFITTHDQTWARQLRLEGVVTSKGVVELYDWQIETGPRVNSQSDMWDAIEKDLRRNDVPAAAHKLRRGSEEYFRSVCNSLGVKVKFNDNGQYTLGDLLPEAISRYKTLINTAKDSANSWNNQEEVHRLVEIERNAKGIFNRTNAENWAVNANVHYNKWTDFNLNDFEPVVTAFSDLFSVFICDNCGTMLHLSLDGNKEEAVRCKCGSVYWNLSYK